MRTVNYDWNKFTVFRRKERAAIQASKSSMVGITALIGLPSLSVLIWQGINWGYQLGATVAVFGALSGGTAGAVIGGVIASIVFVAIVALLYFKVSKWLLQAWRRVSQGSENYRFLKQECKQDTHHEVAQMIEIAKQLKILQDNGIRFPQTQALYAGLTPIQESLFKAIFTIILRMPTRDQAELAIARNKTLHGLRKERCSELLQRVRAMKAQAVFQSQQNPHVLPVNIQDGITPGRSPWALFHKIRDWFSPRKSLVQQANMMTTTAGIPLDMLEAQPHHTLLHPQALIYSLLNLETQQIAGFSAKLLGIDAHYARQLPATLYQEIQRHNVAEEMATDVTTKARALNEMTYLVGHVYRNALTWFNEDQTFLQESQDTATGVAAANASSSSGDVVAGAEEAALIQSQRVAKAPSMMSQAELASYLSYLKAQQRDTHHSQKQQREVEFSIARTEKLMNMCVA